MILIQIERREKKLKRETRDSCLAQGSFSTSRCDDTAWLPGLQPSEAQKIIRLALGQALLLVRFQAYHTLKFSLEKK